MDATRTIDADVLVAGGGLVGLSLALALGRAGLAVAVVDRETPAVAASDPFDGRASAIAWGSRQVLAGIGLWQRIDALAAPIREIRVSDGASPLFLHYDHREAADHPLGAIVENRHLRRALHAAVAETATIAFLAPATIAALERGPARVRATLADGRAIRAALAVACDGRRSKLREEAGIKTIGWTYPQTGIVTSIRHQRAHAGIAHERFLPAGPFAVLPLVDGEDGTHRSSIVWTERASLAPAMLALDDAEFSAEMQARFGDALGRIEVAAGRWAHPLELLQAERYVAPRLALAGDAAHAIHPIAGLGLNLGLRDVAALAECVVDAARLGLDVGAPLVLEKYERWRRVDSTALMAVTDGLNRLFSTDLAPVALARDLGLAAVDALAPLKRVLMRHAMGIVGDLPRLSRGERL